MDFITKNIWFILFVAWGIPLSYYRSKFRKIVYQTDSWLINIKPLFWKEIKASSEIFILKISNIKSLEISTCSIWLFISCYLLLI